MSSGIRRPVRDTLSRTGLAVATMAVAAGCTGQQPVPEWRDPPVSAAAPAGTTTPGTAGAASTSSDGGRGWSTAGAAADSGIVTPAGPTRVSKRTTPVGAAALGGRFLQAVRAQLPEVAVDRRNEEITELGGEACTSLAAGQGRGEVATELTGYGLAADDARRLVTLARSTICRG